MIVECRMIARCSTYSAMRCINANEKLGYSSSPVQILDLRTWVLLYYFVQFGRARDAWRACRNFIFGNLINLLWHVEIFSNVAPQATKNSYIRHIITKWFRHLVKISVTCVTIRRPGGGAWCVTVELNEILQYPYIPVTCISMALVAWLCQCHTGSAYYFQAVTVFIKTPVPQYYLTMAM